MFKCLKNRFFNFENTLIQSFGNLLVAHHYLLGNTCYQVPAIYRKIIRGVVNFFHGSAYLYLDLLSRTFTDQQAMVTAKCLHNISSKFITGDTDRLIADDTSQCDNCDTCCTAADINDHIAYRFFHINTNTQCGSHGLMNQVYFFSPCLFSTIPNGPFLYLSN